MGTEHRHSRRKSWVNTEDLYSPNNASSATISQGPRRVLLSVMGMKKLLLFHRDFRLFFLDIFFSLNHPSFVHPRHFKYIFALSGILLAVVVLYTPIPFSMCTSLVFITASLLFETCKYLVKYHKMQSQLHFPEKYSIWHTCLSHSPLSLPCRIEWHLQW